MKSMQKIIRLYVIGPYTPVVESQVINWLEVLANNGIVTHCLSIIDNTNQKIDQSEKKNIESRIQGNYYEYIRSKSPFIRDIGSAIALFRLYFKYIKDATSIVVQSRNNILGNAILFIKCFPKVSFVFEARASGVIEHSDYHQKDSIKTKIHNLKLRYYESLYVRNADKIICVSHKLKVYFIKQYRVTNENTYTVIPGLADADIFYYNDQLRKETRFKNNWDDRFVFLYSGGIDLPWQISDVVFTFFSKLHLHNPKSFFVVLTRQIELAKSLFERYNIPHDSYYIEFVVPEKLNQFYNAADYGLLFREDRPTNNTASPTKFSEYMLSGLPVLITEGVGDFSDFVKNNDCGFVLNIKDINSGDYTYLFNGKHNNDRRRDISKLGINNFAKQSYVKQWIKLLNA